MPDGGMLVDKDSLKRVFDVTRYVEAQPRYRPARGCGPDNHIQAVYGVTSSVITAKSGSTLGHGTATLQYVTLSGSTYTYQAIPSIPDVTVLNGGSTSVPSGSLVVLDFVSGYWALVGVFC